MNKTRQGIGGKWAVFMAVAIAAGCDSNGDQATVTNTGAIVATVHVSDTHTVSFLDYGEGQAGIQETLDLDKDKDAPVKLVGMSLEGRTLSDIYRLFAGQHPDAILLGNLQALDAHVAEVARTTTVTPETQKIIASDTSFTSPPAAESARAPLKSVATKLAAPAGIEAQQSAVACGEPAWDWTTDDGWFKDNFCGPTSKACYTQVTWANTGWHVGGWFTATGFDQSFCSTANWNVQKKIYGGFPSYGIAIQTLVNTTLQPRTLQTSAWTNISSSHAYFAQVTSTTGSNATGLAFLSN